MAVLDKKYLSWTGLLYYHSLLKELLDGNLVRMVEEDTSGDGAESTFLKKYHLYRADEDKDVTWIKDTANAANIIGSINIPKDFLVKSGTVVTVSETQAGTTGFPTDAGTYLKFIVNTHTDDPADEADEVMWIDVKDLVDIYLGIKNKDKDDDLYQTEVVIEDGTDGQEIHVDFSAWVEELLNTIPEAIVELEAQSTTEADFLANGAKEIDEKLVSKTYDYEIDTNGNLHLKKAVDKVESDVIKAVSKADIDKLFLVI